MSATTDRPREQVVVRVAPDGTISAGTVGMKGARCLDYVALLEELLDATTTSSVFTPEYQQTDTHTHDEARNDVQQR